MRILLINHEYPPIGGGAGNACAHLSHALVRLDVEVTVVTAAADNLPSDEMCDSVRTLRVGPTRRLALEASPAELVGFSVAAYGTARRLATESSPDLLHAFFGVPSGAVCWRLNRTTGLPYLISFRGRDVHGGKARENRGIGGWMKAVSRPVWRSASSLIANSEGLRDIARDVDPSVEVSVIPNGVDTERFTPKEKVQNPDPVELLYVGRLESYKGVDDLLQAVGLLATKGLSIKLSLVGDGSLRDELPALAKRIHIEDRVSFLGPVFPDAVPDLYRDADVFVLPSIVEGMPNVVLEAMASGLPVVATQIPGSEELVVDGATGRLVEARSPSQLAEALEDLVRNSDRRAEMGREGRAEAERRSWRSVAESYLRRYEGVLEGSRSCAASAAS